MAEEKKAKKTESKKSDKKKSDKKNPFKSIAAFFKSVKSEGKKVVWPKSKEVWKNTLVVLVVILIVGVIIYAVDLGLSQGMKGIKQLANDKATTSAVSDDDSSLGEEMDLDEDAADTTTEAAE